MLFQLVQLCSSRRLPAVNAKTSGFPAFVAEGAAGARRFAEGKGRHGDFSDL